MKQQSGKDMVIFGGAGIVQTLTNLSLVDEYHLLVQPVILGSGKPLFKDIKDRIHLKLLKTVAFKKGVVGFSYQTGRD